MLLVFAVGFLYKEFWDWLELFASSSAREYFTNERNMLDSTTFLLIATGVVVRVTNSEQAQDSVQITMANLLQCVGTILSMMQLLWVAQLNYHLGPMLLIFGKMLTALVTFVLILGTVVVFFTLGLRKLMIETSMSWVVKRMFWTLFGEMSTLLETFNPSSDLRNAAENCFRKRRFDVDTNSIVEFFEFNRNLSCEEFTGTDKVLAESIRLVPLNPPWRREAAEIVYAVYVCIAVVLLLNLLIAVLNNA